jgi:hypothetical protein
MTSESRGLTRTDDADVALELGAGIPNEARAESASTDKQKPAITDPWMENQGIVVTTEIKVEVSQEDRIERVIGF